MSSSVCVRLSVCRYICMYICTDLYMYVCLYLCMYVFMYAFMYVLMYCMYAFMYVCKSNDDVCLCINVFVYVCTHVCMYVSTYVSLFNWDNMIVPLPFLCIIISSKTTSTQSLQFSLLNVIKEDKSVTLSLSCRHPDTPLGIPAADGIISTWVTRNYFRSSE